MKILVIAPQDFYIERGTPIDVDILVRALCERGESVDLLVYRNGSSREYPGMRIIRTNTPKWLTGIEPGFSCKKILADFWLYAKAVKLAKANAYDVIHAGEEAAFMAMRLAKKRSIPYVYDMDSSIAQQMIEKMPWLRPLRPLFNHCEAKAIREAAAAAPVCHALADLAREKGAKEIHTLHDISQLNEDSFRFSESIREKHRLQNPVLMYVGNLETYQGIDLLLKAYAITQKEGLPLDLVVAGGSPGAIAQYQKKAEKLAVGDKARFIGPWPANRLGELLAQADILTAPRIKGINTPMKVFPYLHSGRAVLVTDLPTHSQVLDSTVCELAPPEPKGFAKSIRKLAENAKYREQLGQSGRRFVERNHTYTAHKNRVDKLYDYLGEIRGKTFNQATIP